MIAVDTNLLVYAHRQDSPWHREALRALLDLAEGNRRWGIPWPCVHEFISVVTHPRIYSPPTLLDVAFQAIEVWLRSPLCRPIGEGSNHLEELKKVAVRGKAEGPMIHDARIAAISAENGVTELWSADRDFSRYRGLKLVNPLLGRGTAGHR